MPLRKAGGNWVDGEKFFDREAELDALHERVCEGTHTLLTAQRRMGKTSLVRELLRQLAERGSVESIFVDLEDARSVEDAVAEICSRSRTVAGAWGRLKDMFANYLRDAGDHIDELAVSEVRVKLRAGIDSGNWRTRGDALFAALAGNPKPVVLAIDELPILVNRVLKGHDYRITPERRQAADEFLSWLRRQGQEQRGRVCMIISGSVGLEPVLRQAGLTAHANIFSRYELHPWSEATAIECLAELANSYGINLSQEVSQGICRRLRICIPHHVQQFFDNIHEHLRRASRRDVSPADVESVYTEDMLSVRGQLDLEHYETRLKAVLGPEAYQIAIDMLTEAATHDGLLSHESVTRYRDYLATSPDAAEIPLDDVLYVLEHDGYLTAQPDGYRMISGLLEDWWYARHGRPFVSITNRTTNPETERGS